MVYEKAALQHVPTDLRSFGFVVQLMAHGHRVVPQPLRGATHAVRRQVVAHVRCHPIVVGVPRVECVARRSKHWRNLQ